MQYKNCMEPCNIESFKYIVLIPVKIKTLA